MKRFLLISLLSVLFIEACRKDEVPQPVYSDLFYYPLQVGACREYYVDSATLTNGQWRYASGILRESIVEHFSGSAGQQVFRLRRQWKYDSVTTWKESPVHFAWYENNSVKRDEENIIFTRMSFPIKVGRAWQGTPEFELNQIEDQELLYLSNWQFYYEEVHQPWEEFDSTVLVIERKENLGISVDTFYSRYAYHIGLVERYSLHMERDSLNQPFQRGFRAYLRFKGTCD
ncbi:MAG: hypothetical protein GXO48_07865 [Chlorobi bacterium]|nr:hypothetical protein [Chlorobiota bacterium]